MPDIGIIGGGVGGTHLGLFLRQHGVSATIYSAKTPAQHLAARITNVVCHSGTTRAGERALRVDFWDAAVPDLEQFVVTVNGPRLLTFSGALNPPTHVVDRRIYWARCSRNSRSVAAPWSFARSTLATLRSSPPDTIS
jgi:styrene monooxygenase